MWVGSTARRVAIIGGVRIPFARGNGAYARSGNQDLLTAALRGVVERFGLQDQRMDEVAAGAVVKHADQWNLTREAVMGSGLSLDTPGFDVQRACGSGMEAVISLGNKIALGQIDCAIAGGVDTASDPPVAYPKSFQQLLLSSYRGRTAGQRLKPWFGLRPRHLRPVLPGMAEPRTGLSMGDSAELLVKSWGISRQEQDQLAFDSHRKASAAYASGFYRGLVREHLGLSEDDNVRGDVNLDKLALLRTAFDGSATGTVTAGNAAPMADGAAAVLMATEDWAHDRDLPVLAYLTHVKSAAVDFTSGKEGSLMAPAYAVARLLKDAKLSLQDFDFYEIHEAFAGQVLSTLKAWTDASFCRDRLGSAGALGAIDRGRLNVKGGSIAIGHPFAATGTRIVGTLAKILEENKGGRGLVSICTAGGMGITAILER